MLKDIHAKEDIVDDIEVKVEQISKTDFFMDIRVCKQKSKMADLNTADIDTLFRKQA